MITRDNISSEASDTRSNSAGWMIQRLARNLTASMSEKLRPHGLKVDQFALLMVLAEGGNLTQTALGQRARQPNYAVTRSLDILAERGLVERRKDATSRRSHRVFLTGKGRALMPVLFQIVAEVNADLMAGLEADERAGFLLSLKKMLR